jgi:hypothetical protein
MCGMKDFQKFCDFITLNTVVVVVFTIIAIIVIVLSRSFS